MTRARNRWIMEASCFTVLIGGKLSVVCSLVKPGIGCRTSDSEPESWQRVRSQTATPFASTVRSRLTLTWTKRLTYSGWLVVESYNNATGGSAAPRRQHWNNESRALGESRRMLNFSTARAIGHTRRRNWDSNRGEELRLVTCNISSSTRNSRPR